MKRHGDTIRWLVPKMRYLAVAIACTLLMPSIVVGFQLLSVAPSTRSSKLRTWSGVRSNDERSIGPSTVFSSSTNTKYYYYAANNKINSNTQLCMGLRSFLRNRKSKNEGEEGNGQGQDDGSQAEGGEGGSFDLPPPPPSKASLGEDYFKRPAIFQRANQRNSEASEREDVNENGGPDAFGETVQDRMRRMSTGEMTAEEKEAFLDRTLTWSATKEKNSKGSKKTIRQSLPLGGVPVKLYDENDADAQANNSAPSQSGKSPGTSAETSWSHVVSAKRHEQQSRYGVSSPKAGGVPLMDDAAKEAWLNMVTSPTRFQGYSAVQPASEQASNMEMNAPQTQPVTQQQLKDLSEAKRRLLEQQKLFSEMAQGSKTSGEKLLESSPFLPRGAGSQLGDDGEGEEKSEKKDDVTIEGASVKLPASDKDPSTAPPSISSSVAETRKETVTSSSPAQTKNGTNDLAARLEQAAMVQEKKDREARENMQQENDRIQKEEQRRLMERQRESQRLSEEQESLKLRRRSEEEKKLAQAEQQQRDMENQKRKQLEEVQMEYWSKKLADEQAAKDVRTSEKDSSEKDDAQSIRLAKEKQANQIRMRQVQVDDERDLLQKAARQREESRARAEAITNNAAAKLTPGGTVPPPSNRGADSFIKSQAARKDALKRFTQDQQSHLRDLNSLNQPPKPRAAVPPPPPSSPIMNRAVAGGGGSQLPRPLPARDDSTPRPGPTPSPTGISVGDLMSGRVRDDDEALNQFKDLDDEGKDMSEDEAQQGIMDTLARAKATVRPPPQRSGQPIRQQVPSSNQSQPQQRTGPVRQKLPTVVQADETDVIQPSSPAPKPSSIDISDADKKRANKWGINLDKLL